MEKGGSQTNPPKDKKIDDDTQGFSSLKWQTDDMFQEKEEEALSSILEDCVDAWKRNKERRKKDKLQQPVKLLPIWEQTEN